MSEYTVECKRVYFVFILFSFVSITAQTHNTNTRTNVVCLCVCTVHMEAFRSPFSHSILFIMQVKSKLLSTK